MVVGRRWLLTSFSTVAPCFTAYAMSCTSQMTGWPLHNVSTHSEAHVKVAQLHGSHAPPHTQPLAFPAT